MDSSATDQLCPFGEADQGLGVLKIVTHQKSFTSALTSSLILFV